jgi:hypothetical protein
MLLVETPAEASCLVEIREAAQPAHSQHFCKRGMRANASLQAESWVT